ncbi:hypothetical protein ES703_78695 [subsurface metagenome]
MESRISFQAGLVDLMNLFINWGINIFKIKYIDIMRKASFVLATNQL